MFLLRDLIDLLRYLLLLRSADVISSDKLDLGFETSEKPFY